VNGQLVNLSIKIDRMLAETQPKTTAFAPVASKTRSAGKTARKAPRKK
jgi:hypothetical protein